MEKASKRMERKEKKFIYSNFFFFFIFIEVLVYLTTFNVYSLPIIQFRSTLSDTKIHSHEGWHTSIFKTIQFDTNLLNLLIFFFFHHSSYHHNYSTNSQKTIKQINTLSPHLIAYNHKIWIFHIKHYTNILSVELICIA